MSLRRVRLPDGVKGSLWLSAMPGRFSSWREFERDVRKEKLHMVVCLTGRDEMLELSPQYHAAVQNGGISFEWLHLPVPNFGVPQDQKAFREGVDRVVQALQAGQPVMLHCAAGMGRTGSMAACVLKALGLPTDEALERVRAAGSNPQNAAQSGFVDWF
jgi:protein tyrosine/serine phosphatase